MNSQRSGIGSFDDNDEGVGSYGFMEPIHKKYKRPSTHDQNPCTPPRSARKMPAKIKSKEKSKESSAENYNAYQNVGTPPRSPKKKQKKSKSKENSAVKDSAKSRKRNKNKDSSEKKDSVDKQVSLGKPPLSFNGSMR